MELTKRYDNLRELIINREHFIYFHESEPIAYEHEPSSAALIVAKNFDNQRSDNIDNVIVALEDTKFTIIEQEKLNELLNNLVVQNCQDRY